MHFRLERIQCIPEFCGRHGGVQHRVWLGASASNEKCILAFIQQSQKGHHLQVQLFCSHAERSGELTAEIAYITGQLNNKLAQMVEQYREWRGSILAVQEVPAEHTRRYGIVAGSPVSERVMAVNRIVEKPSPDQAPSLLGVAGRYILSPAVFEQIRRQPRGVGNEIQLTDGIAGLLKTEPVYAYRYVGKRHDCGSKEGFLEANVELALKHPQIGPGFSAYLRQLMQQTD